MRHGTGLVFDTVQETPMVKHRMDDLLLARGLAADGAIDTARFPPANRKERRIAAAKNRRSK